jgi:hypothetical protein
MSCKRGRRPLAEAPSIAAGQARDVVEILVREAGELNARRCLQTIVVVDGSCDARPGSHRGRGKFTTVVLDTDAFYTERRAHADVAHGRDVDGELCAYDDESFDLVRSEPEEVW